jgi:hypothetical protein
VNSKRGTVARPRRRSAVLARSDLAHQSLTPTTFAASPVESVILLVLYSLRIANSGHSGDGVVRAIRSRSGLQRKNWTMLPLALRIPRHALRAHASHPAPRVKGTCSGRANREIEHSQSPIAPVQTSVCGIHMLLKKLFLRPSCGHAEDYVSGVSSLSPCVYNTEYSTGHRDQGKKYRPVQSEISEIPRLPARSEIFPLSSEIFIFLKFCHPNRRQSPSNTLTLIHV